MVTITKNDILDALRSINFVERDSAIARNYTKRFPQIKPPIDRKAVFEIIRKLGYEPGHEQDFYYLKNQSAGNVFFELQFTLKYSLIEVFLVIYNEGEPTYGGLWRRFEHDLGVDPKNCISHAKYSSYEEIEGILAAIFGIYEDFKKALFEAKGIIGNEN